jgi:hypothetical protein
MIRISANALITLGRGCAFTPNCLAYAGILGATMLHPSAL